MATRKRQLIRRLVPESGRFTSQQIFGIIYEHEAMHVREYGIIDKYYEGKNETIQNRVTTDTTSPNNIIPVPYGRKIIQTVTGYMFKPQLINYESENEQYKAAIDYIFSVAGEDSKTSIIGKQVSTYGLGVELHYVKNIDGIETPFFSVIRPHEMAIVYNYDMEPEIICAIRYWKKPSSSEDTYRFDRGIEVYYPNEVEYYDMKMSGSGRGVLQLLETKENVYGEVPVNEYWNNEERMGDFEPVIPLIDAYDALMSDAINEVDRFANAYLVMKNFKITTENVEQIKLKRIFEVFGDGAINFLTKDINDTFIMNMKEWIRDEIHQQSHVPDFLEKTGDSLSGVAISKLLYDFELIAATKESYFRDGINRRLKLINKILKIKTGKTYDASDISVVMERNTPSRDKENAEVAALYKGLISDESIIGRFATFIRDASKEMERRKEEQSEYKDVEDDQKDTVIEEIDKAS